MGRARVDVQDFVVGLPVPFRRGVLHEVVAHGNHEISLLDEVVGVVLLRDADGADGIVVVKRDHALGHHRVDDGDVQGAGEVGERLAAVVADGGVAREDDGALAAGEQVSGGAHAGDFREFGARVKGVQRLFAGAGGDLHARDVARQVDVAGSRFFGLGIFEGNANDFIHGIGAHDLAAALRHRLEERRQVEELVRGEVHALRADLARDGHERCAVHVRIGYAGDEVRGAWAEGSEADASASRETAVDIGHEGRALLVAHGDELDGRVAQCLDDLQIFLARNAEDVLDAFAFQAFDQDLCRVHRFVILSQIECIAADAAVPKRKSLLRTAKSEPRQASLPAKSIDNFFYECFYSS